MLNQTSDTADQISALLNEILLAPSTELLNDRFNPAHAACAANPGCKGGCSGSCGGNCSG